MLRKLMRLVSYRANVYEGISPSLLATMSLGVNIKGSSHLQLIQNLQKSRLVQSQASLLAFQQLDRQLFTKAANPYDNKPYPISNGQRMTDIFTHSIIIENLSNHLVEDALTVLDIGTGHGYLSFLIQKIFTLHKRQAYKVVGIDINQEAITFCNQLRQKIAPNSPISFHCANLEDYLHENSAQKYDIIIGGYYLDQGFSSLLQEKLSQRGVGIWSTRSDQGQALYKFQKNKEKTYLIETMFSMPLIRKQISKYFLTEDEVTESVKQNAPKLQIDTTIEQKQKRRKQAQEKLKEDLRILLQYNRKEDGKLLTLVEMKNHPQISEILKKLTLVSKGKVLK